MTGRQAMRLAKRRRDLARLIQQGPSQITAPRPHGRQAVQSATAEEMEEEGFRLIVLGMAGRDAAGAHPRHHLPEHRIANLAGRCLDRAAVAGCVGNDVNPHDLTGEAQGGGLARHEGGILIRLRAAEPMMHVRHPDLETKPWGQRVQAQEQAEGISPAGDRRHYALGGAENRVFPAKVGDVREQR